METILAWDSKSHGGTMPKAYLHLTCEQRGQICALLQTGHSQAHIARTIGVDPSTISRELVRNTGARGYRFKQAHEKALQRRKEASDKPRKMEVPISLLCLIPRSKGSRTNSTLVPERYSATELLVRFSSTPKISPLHFAVEWAR